METTNKIFKFFLSIMVCVIIITIASAIINVGIITDTIKIFEDDSWAIGEYPYPVHGCKGGGGFCGDFSLIVLGELLVGG